MAPVVRSWAVHKGHKSMCTRKGFTVIPNFAGTAHMVQGQTLDAGIADFLDIDTASHPHEEVAAYIAASRIRRADVPLIMRVVLHISSHMVSSLGLTCSWR